MDALEDSIAGVCVVAAQAVTIVVSFSIFSGSCIGTCEVGEVPLENFIFAFFLNKFPGALWDAFVNLAERLGFTWFPPCPRRP